MMDADYQICLRTPSAEEYIWLRAISGLSPFAPEAVEKGLAGTIFAIVVQQQGKAVAMGRLVGDGGCFFQIVDIAVDPAHQGKGLGKAIMSELTRYIAENLPRSAHVSLIADVPANRLYEKFGFAETAPASLGMVLKSDAG